MKDTSSWEGEGGVGCRWVGDVAVKPPFGEGEIHQWIDKVGLIIVGLVVAISVESQLSLPVLPEVRKCGIGKGQPYPYMLVCHKARCERTGESRVKARTSWNIDISDCGLR